MNSRGGFLGLILAVSCLSLGTGTMSGCWNPVGQLDTTGTVAAAPDTHLVRLQREYTAMKFGMFIHLNMSTFERCCCNECVSVMGEWATPGVDEKLFHPARLDCGQWARSARSAGCKYMILTSKHHDGFCLWNSKYTTHSIGSSGWGGGRDIVKEFVDSARAYGLAPGLYFSIWDKASGMDTTLIKNQLGELLDTTIYGKIACLWFDGWYWPMEVGYRKVPYQTVKNLIKSRQPDCLLIENNHLHTLDSTEIVEWEFPVEGLVPSSNRDPAEGCVPLLSKDVWFWHPGEECMLKDAQRIAGEVAQVTSGNGSYLLDVTPDTTGLLPQCQVQRLGEIGDALRSGGLAQ